MFRKIDEKNCERKIELGAPGRTLVSILDSYDPSILKQWDNWNFNVIATGNNLDEDKAQFIVTLMNKDHSYQQITIYA